ncbi:MAG TPA: hypothetical protein PKE45_11130, partial [Caldilineaceae bacterium]|nr:hypothetical protein [Caldilineaceae bacterium]
MRMFWRLILVLFWCGLALVIVRRTDSTVLAAGQAVSSEQVADTTATDTQWRAWDQLPFAIKSKVDPRILAELRGDLLPIHLSNPRQAGLMPPSEPRPLERTRFLVFLREQPDLTALSDQVFASQVARRAELLTLLTSETAAAQAAVKAALDADLAAKHVSAYQPFYIVNTLAVEGDLASLVSLAQRPDVARIVANYPLMPLQREGTPLTETVQSAALDPLNWNIARVGADQVWTEFGVRGEGAVVA